MQDIKNYLTIYLNTKSKLAWKKEDRTSINNTVADDHVNAFCNCWPPEASNARSLFSVVTIKE